MTKYILCCKNNTVKRLFLLATLTGGGLLLDDGLDDTDGNGLSHVADGEAAQRRVVRESLDNHGLGGLQGDHAGITVLDELRVGLEGLAGTAIHLLIDVLELGGDVRSVAIQDGGIAVLDLAGVGHDDHLGGEGLHTLGWVVSVVGGDVATLDVLDGNVLAVEANVVSGDSLGEGLVVHLDGLHLSGKTDGAEAHGHSRLDDAGLDTAHRHRANTTDLVHILKGQAEGLVGGSLGGSHKVQGLEEDGALVPRHGGGALNHVVSDPSGDRHEGDLDGLVSDLLQVGRHLLLDIVVSGLGVLARVHLVQGNDHLGHTKGEGKESVLLGLALSGPTTLETTGGRVDDQDGNIGLGSAGNHVLDEISVAGGIDHSEIVLGGLELPESDINGDTTLTLGLEVIKDPGVLERGLAELGSLLLELLDGTLVDTTALVDQVTSGGGLTGIDVTNDDEGDVDLFLGHFERIS